MLRNRQLRRRRPQRRGQKCERAASAAVLGRAKSARMKGMAGGGAGSGGEVQGAPAGAAVACAGAAVDMAEAAVGRGRAAEVCCLIDAPWSNA